MLMDNTVDSAAADDNKCFVFVTHMPIDTHLTENLFGGLQDPHAPFSAASEEELGFHI